MPIDRTKYEVPAADLRRVCEPVTIDDEEQEDLALGQEEALDAMNLGLQMANDEYAQRHYNIMVVGPPNTGRLTRTINYLRARAAQEPCQPPDAIALHDFDSPRLWIEALVPNGTGEKISDLLFEFGKWSITELSVEIDNWRHEQLESVPAQLHVSYVKAGKIGEERNCFFLLDEQERQYDFRPKSLANPSQPISPEEYDQLEKDIQLKLSDAREESLELASSILEDAWDTADELANKIFSQSVDKATERCRQKLQTVRELVGENSDFERYLKGLTKHIGRLAAVPHQDDDSTAQHEHMAIMHYCQVQVSVDNSQVKHKKVVHVDAPRFTRLFGCPHAESNSQGPPRMDHTMVEGGAFLEANQSYIVIEFSSMNQLGRGPAFMKMFEVVRTGKLTIETVGNFMDADTLLDYRSNEITLNVRVVLICTPEQKAELDYLAPDFCNLFRTVSEFKTTTDYERAKSIYARFVRSCCRSDKLPSFSSKTVAKLVEYGARLAEDQNKASLEVGLLKGVIREAAYVARQNKSRVVHPTHLRQAFSLKSETASVRNYLDYIDSGHALLSHEGTAVGQINVLTISELSNGLVLGTPKRVTARCFAGQGKVLLVQRNIKCSGPSSNGAVDTITGYLLGKYGRRRALPLTVQLSFEQTCLIDGDSASIAEYIAIVSAITELPILQCGTITGSMNQMGEVQTIGGVNEKVEGIFDLLLRQQLLDGSHFTVVPELNVQQFMLDEDLVEAQRQLWFQVYAISHVDQALEIFLDQPIEEINRRMEAKIDEIQQSTNKKT